MTENNPAGPTLAPSAVKRPSLLVGLVMAAVASGFVVGLAVGHAPHNERLTDGGRHIPGDHAISPDIAQPEPAAPPSIELPAPGEPVPAPVEMTWGRVVSTSGQDVVIETYDGTTVQVRTNGDTKVTATEEVAIADLAVGQEVSVVGSRVELTIDAQSVSAGGEGSAFGPVMPGAAIRKVAPPSGGQG